MTSPDTRSSSSNPSANGGRTRSIQHPRYTLKAVEDFVRTIVEMGARHCDQEQVAKRNRYSGAKNGAFKGLRAAASYFGTVLYSNDSFLSVTEPWIEAIRDDDEGRIRELRIAAMQRPELYKMLIEEFEGKQLPMPAERLAQRLSLTPRYGILKDAADTAARVFVDSAVYAGLLDSNNFIRIPASTDVAADGDTADDSKVALEQGGKSAPERSGMPGPAGVVASLVDLPATEGMDRLEVQLANGRRAYLIVPVPLPAKEKQRLKNYIDLIIEPDEYDSPPHRQVGDAGASGGSA